MLYNVASCWLHLKECKEDTKKQVGEEDQFGFRRGRGIRDDANVMLRIS
jgi:hypothetical protein